MSEANQSQDFLKRHHFLLRRLHSLSGIVPVGLFVIMHLFTNFQLMVGDFQHEVNFIHSLPALLFLEIGIWGGIAFHAILGVMYMLHWLPNVRDYKYGDNWRYTMQRYTGWIALIFIFLHVATLRWQWTFGGFFTTFYVSSKDGHPLAAATTAQALQNTWVLIGYIIGVAAVVFHFANGLWTAAITWGLTITVGAQRRWGYVCCALGIALTVFAAGAIIGARVYDITDADRAAIQRADEQGGGHHGNLIEH